MNQAMTTTAGPKAGNAADAPDILVVLRRYAWMVFGGTAIGGIVALGLFLFFNRYYPNYTASVTFQVMPPAPGVGEKLSAERNDVQPSQEEIGQFINRQILYIRSDAVINQALQSDAFQHDPVTGQRSRWLAEHSVNPKRELKKALTVDPKISAAVFTIGITTDDNNEAANLVNAVARVYLDALTADNKENQSQKNQQLNDILISQQKTVKALEDRLAEFRKANDISAIINLHSLELNLLEQMDAALLRAESERVVAKATLDNINDQVKSGTLQLSADMKQYVENQPELLNLNQTLLALQQEKQVAMLNASISNTLRSIGARIDTVNDQIGKTREKLENDARLRMQERADTDYKSLLATTQYMEKAHADKLAKVQDLDHFMVENQQQMDALKNQKDILDDLTQKYTLSQLQNATDDTRIRKLGGDAVAPDKSEISWPLWYYFVPTGAILGLLLSYAAAYLFELTNTRVRTPSDITRTIQLPLLGFVPDKEDDAELTGALATSIRTSPASMVAESFRQIRGRLIAQADGHPVSTLLVASIAPGGGATTVASNLANGMALNKMRVLLVDANFYRPGLKANYPNIPVVGLSDVIEDAAKLDSSIVFNTELPNLHLMGPGGRPTAGTGEILESKSFAELLKTLKSRYDIVIFDGAPLNLVSDSISIGARVDGVIAVVKAGEVSRGTVVRVREQLRQVRANLLGVVLNAAQTHGAGYFKENYRTFYEYAGPAPRAVASAN